MSILLEILILLFYFQVFILWVYVSVVTCHVFIGQDHHHVLHHISDLPHVISSIIKQSLDHSILHHHEKYKPELFGNGGYQLGIGDKGKPQGFSDFDFNFKPSDIFGGNLFGSQEFIGEGNDGSGNTGSQESSGDEGLFQNPGDFTGSAGTSGETYDGSQIPNSGVNIDIPNRPDDASQGDNGGNLNTNINEKPSQDNVNDGSTSEIINSGINENNGIGNVDGSDSGVAQSGEPGEATNIDGQGPFVPSSVGVDGNIRENKQNTVDSVGEKPKTNVNINLDVPGDVLDSVNAHVNVPNSLNSQNTGTEVGTLDTQNPTLDINKPEGQINNTNSAIGVEGQKLNRESAPFQNRDDLKVEGESHSNNLDTNSKQSLNDTKESVDGLQLVKKDESNQDGKLKTNVLELGDGDLDVAISKHRDKHSIIFPDKLKEAKEKIQKQKINVNDMGASQTPNLSGRNGIDNGQFLYAINIAPALTNQGSYIPPATSVNTGQQANYVPNNALNVPVTGQSAPVQYVVQNPSSTRSNIVPNSNVVYSSPSGGTSTGYTMVNVPNSGNSPGQVLYNLPASYQGGLSNGYYQANNNPSPQAYYTVQLSNGQTALVPVSSDQMYTSGHNNGPGQVMVPSNSQQYVVSNGQPIQSNGQVLMSNNGQQYIPSNGNGQVFVSSNGQQYVLANSQPDQGNVQVVVPSNSQQYIQGNVQPANGPVIVSNGQNYVPNGQVSVPWSGGQGTVQNSGQVYVPFNSNQQNNMVAVPSGSIMNVGGDSNSVPVMVLQGFKDKGEPSSSPSSSGEKLDQSKDKIDDEK